MLDQDIPMKWVAVIFSTLIGCMIFGWWYITTPSANAKIFADCLQTPKLSKQAEKDKKILCDFVVADHVARDSAKAACASRESSTFQKCEVFNQRNIRSAFTDVIIVNSLKYRDDWNNLRFADYTVRLTRASVDDLDWRVANTEFSRE